MFKSYILHVRRLASYVFPQKQSISLQTLLQKPTKSSEEDCVNPKYWRWAPRRTEQTESHTVPAQKGGRFINLGRNILQNKWMRKKWESYKLSSRVGLHH